ncbi:hypothetical protein AG1IA_08795 [Rhizoctonia solani AG-1 IA]|uniref:Uncharacterized protein n=1 Tax=Thanatephorus cucumeris (strain AG1-IA) TaxID=983506 RepID=L8WGW6_THACA|nr:hypothetical protein AG1IA_08795 [Rhizoctonia solani AG-1 IA]
MRCNSVEQVDMPFIYNAPFSKPAPQTKPSSFRPPFLIWRLHHSTLSHKHPVRFSEHSG